MKKINNIILVGCLLVYLAGCGQKEKALEEGVTTISMETLTAPGAEVSQSTVTAEPQAAEPKVAAKLEQLPSAGPFKPTGEEIQTALKNAGFYTGNIDGKVGPKTKKAIEEFQKTNGLKADAKVGPMTWDALNKYLAP